MHRDIRDLKGKYCIYNIYCTILKIDHTTMFVIHPLTDVRCKKTYKHGVPIYSLCFVTFSATRFNFPL